MNTINLVKKIRFEIIKMSYRSKAPHLASSLSCADIITVLYEKILIINKKKEISQINLYLVKVMRLLVFTQYCRIKSISIKKNFELCKKRGSLLEEHPNPKVNGVEAPTGSLGHGLPIGCGIALAAKIKKKKI